MTTQMECFYCESSLDPAFKSPMRFGRPVCEVCDNRDYSWDCVQVSFLKEISDTLNEIKSILGVKNDHKVDQPNECEHL